jgi:hypothetical protein
MEEGSVYKPFPLPERSRWAPRQGIGRHPHYSQMGVYVGVKDARKEA